MSSARGPVDAAVFDVDGTLYPLGPVRRGMLIKLMVDGVRQGRPISRSARILRRYRSHREQLREHRPPGRSLAEAEILGVAEALRVPAEKVERAVHEWIHRRPLGLLRRARPRELRPAFEELRAMGLSIGVFSDHAVGDKLDALGIADLVDVARSALDPDIDAFKPDPRGFLVCCRDLGVEPGRAVYVGDRYEIDAVGAVAAGMRAVLVGRAAGTGPGEVPQLAGVGALPEWIRGLG